MLLFVIYLFLTDEALVASYSVVRRVIRQAVGIERNLR